MYWVPFWIWLSGLASLLEGWGRVGGSGGWNELGGARWGAGVVGAIVRPPNGPILLKCEACTFLTRYNKSINCVWVCTWERYVCVCTMHEEKIWWHLNRKYPRSFSSIDVTVTVTAKRSAHHNAGWHMPHNGYALYHERNNHTYKGTCVF